MSLFDPRPSRLVLDAECFARKRHHGQMHGSITMEDHLKQVVDELIAFGYTDPHTLAAAWLHDVVEDTDITLGDLYVEFDLVVVHLVGGLTDIDEDAAGNKLPNRRARQQATYRNLIRVAQQYPQVMNIKLADRIANIKSNLPPFPDRTHLGMYCQEHPFFCRSVGQAGGDPKMWAALDKLVSKGYRILTLEKQVQACT